MPVIASPSLSKQLHEELGSAIRGQVFLRDDPEYAAFCV
jgi:hypothetical protein